MKVDFVNFPKVFSLPKKCRRKKCCENETFLVIFKHCIFLSILGILSKRPKKGKILNSSLYFRRPFGQSDVIYTHFLHHIRFDAFASKTYFMSSHYLLA